MISTTTYTHRPSEHECERASNSYLMSLFAIFVGLPLPIMNLLATVIFYLGNRKSTSFVRWHCTQALLTQITLFIINSFTLWMTVFNVINEIEFTLIHFGIIGVVLLINLIDFIFTVITAIQVRKGLHVKWILYSRLTDRLMKD